MFRTLAIVAAFALAAGSATAQKIDANGRCHAANGQFAKAEVCGGVSKSTTTTKTTAAKTETATTAPAGSTATATKCRDAKGHFMKCDAAAAPAASAKPDAGAYKLDAKGKCHDAKGKMAKKEMCKA